MACKRAENHTHPPLLRSTFRQAGQANGGGRGENGQGAWVDKEMAVKQWQAQTRASSVPVIVKTNPLRSLAHE